MRLLYSSIINKKIRLKASDQILSFINFFKKDRDIESAIAKTFNGKPISSSLKARLIERTNNAIIQGLLWDTPHANLYGKEFKNSYRHLAAFKILRALALKNDAITLGEWALKKSIKFQITEVTLLLSIELRQHYAFIEGENNYEYYKCIAAEAKKDFLNEQIAEEYYCELVSQFAKNQGVITPQIIDSASKFITHLSNLKDETNTYRFYFWYFYIVVFHKQLINDHISIIENCDKALDYFNNQSFPTPYSTKFSFLFKSIPSHILLSSFETVQESIQKAKSIIPEKGTRNELICYKYMVIGGFHHGQYDYALEGLAKATSYKKKPEEWEIFEAYCHILHISGKIEYAKSKRIGKLMNEVPELTRDKRGLYVNLLFIQTIHWLLKQDYGKIIDRLDAMKVYQSKYLNRSPFNQTRLRCFFLMLRKIAQCAFQKEESIKQTAKLLEELKASPLQENWGNVDIEIFPLETLWEIVVEHLID
jgi:hypothetical protein